jgi:hypothetical protein
MTESTQQQKFWGERMPTTIFSELVGTAPIWLQMMWEVKARTGELSLKNSIISAVVFDRAIKNLHLPFELEKQSYNTVIAVTRTILILDELTELKRITSITDPLSNNCFTYLYRELSDLGIISDSHNPQKDLRAMFDKITQAMIDEEKMDPHNLHLYPQYEETVIVSNGFDLVVFALSLVLNEDFQQCEEQIKLINRATRYVADIASVFRDFRKDRGNLVILRAQERLYTFRYRTISPLDEDSFTDLLPEFEHELTQLLDEIRMRQSPNELRTMQFALQSLFLTYELMQAVSASPVLQKTLGVV